jgi:hypothetical protein
MRSLLAHSRGKVTLWLEKVVRNCAPRLLLLGYHYHCTAVSDCAPRNILSAKGWVLWFERWQ